jgi:nucleoside 2-deoxyribosyltransferase
MSDAELRPANFYLAGPSQFYRECAGIIDDLKRRRHRCTFDWTEGVRAAKERGRPDDDMTRDERRACALFCLDGVARADVVIVLWPSRSKGAQIEFGAALGREVPILLIRWPCVFLSLLYDAVPEEATIWTDKADGDEIADAMERLLPAHRSRGAE